MTKTPHLFFARWDINKSDLHKLQSQPKLESSAVYIGQGLILAGGDKTKVDQLLKALGLFVDVPQRHQSALMIGNDESGWFRPALILIVSDCGRGKLLAGD